MGKWNKVYKEKIFSINTIEPSIIVKKWFEYVSQWEDFRVLDLGCGNLRNSIYSVALGGIVDAIDLEKIYFPQDIWKSNQDKIHFHEMSVMDFNIKKDTYTVIIIARLIQYLTSSEISLLFSRIKNGLTKDGILMLSYTSSWGVLEASDVDVFKKSYSKERVENELKKSWLQIISMDEWRKISTHVPYKIPNLTYDILARRK